MQDRRERTIWNDLGFDVKAHYKVNFSLFFLLEFGLSGCIQLRVLGDLCQNDKATVIETWILKTHLKSSVIEFDIL